VFLIQFTEAEGHTRKSLLPAGRRGLVAEPLWGISASRKAVMVSYDPYSPEVQINPYPFWKQLRDEAPVFHNEDFGFYALSRYDDVLAAFLDPKTYISGEGATIEGLDKGSGGLIQLDDPEHGTYRKILSRVFTPRRIGSLEPFIRTLASTYLDKVAGTERFDVIQDFSLHLPLTVIGELLDIPVPVRQEIHDLTTLAATRSTDPADANIAATVQSAIQALSTLYHQLVADRRRNPGTDVISQLITAEVVDEDGGVRSLTDEVIVAQFLLLAGAGHETVMKAIGNGVVALWWYPDQRAQLCHDPALIPAAVDEILRWDNPAPIEARWTTRDVEVQGCTIPRDSRVLLLQGSANHDDRQYEQPELFSISREMKRPLIFGFGVHLCLGAALARLEMRVAFEELLRRFPDYEVDVAGVERGPVSFFRGLNNLPIQPDRT
jgi:cytochrome P450